AVGGKQQIAKRRVDVARGSAPALELERQARVDERVVEPFDRREVGGRKRKTKTSDRVVDPTVEAPLEVAIGWRKAVDVLDDALERGLAPHFRVLRRRSAGQEREVLHARRRRSKQRLEQEMEQQVVAPDIEDERNRRPDLRDVRKV